MNVNIVILLPVVSVCHQICSLQKQNFHFGKSINFVEATIHFLTELTEIFIKTVLLLQYFFISFSLKKLTLYERFFVKIVFAVLLQQAVSLKLACMVHVT